MYCNSVFQGRTRLPTVRIASKLKLKSSYELAGTPSYRFPAGGRTEAPMFPWTTKKGTQRTRDSHRHTDTFVSYPASIIGKKLPVISGSFWTSLTCSVCSLTAVHRMHACALMPPLPQFNVTVWRPQSGSCNLGEGHSVTFIR